MAGEGCGPILRSENDYNTRARPFGRSSQEFDVIRWFRLRLRKICRRDMISHRQYGKMAESLFSDRSFNRQESSAIGITIHYRGKVADLARIEDLEDRVLDLSLDLGGQAQIWRSSGDAQPGRIVRGLILDHAPGQESMSLLISPEGWLIGLMEIEDAECGRLTEAPWCSVKTQFGSVAGHVALVEMLAALKHEFIPDLEVSDEGGYWEKRDVELLARNFATLQRAIDGLADGLRRHGLSAEAAEDPEILIHRIARIAEKVRRSLGRPCEHVQPGALEDAGLGHSGAALGDADNETDDQDSEAFDEESEWFDEEELAAEVGEEDDDDPQDGPEQEAGQASDIDSEGDESDAGLPDRGQHPLLERASKFFLRLHELFKVAPVGSQGAGSQGALHTLFQGAGNLCGGLAQAMSPREEFIDDRGLRIVQLKRALRGAAFARGVLYNVGSGTMPPGVFESLKSTLEEIEEEMFGELGRLRESL